MSNSLNMKINKFKQKVNNDVANYGYFRNTKELIKFLKLTKYLSNNRSPNKSYTKNIYIHRSPNLVAISKDEYISEFSKSNSNQLKGTFFKTTKRISSVKKLKKQTLYEIRKKPYNKHVNTKSDERYNEVMVRNHNIILGNVKKFLKIDNLVDENKAYYFPFIRKYRNEKKEKYKEIYKEKEREIYKTPPVFKTKLKTINNKIEKNDNIENSFYTKDNKKTCKNFNNNNNHKKNNIKITQQKVPLIKRNSTPNFSNRIINSNSNMITYITTLVKFSDIKKDLIDLNLKTLQPPLLINPSKKEYIFNYYVNKTYRKQIPLYMKHRLNWNLVTDKEEGYSFRWKYYPGRVNYKLYQYYPNIPLEKIRMINLFENYKQIGNKENFFINFIKYCCKNRLNPFQYIPFTIVINKSFMYEKCLKNLEDLNNNMNQDVHSLNNSKIQYTKLFSLMKASGVSNKDFEDLYIYIPPSFISEFNYWIVKPPDLFQGMGIKVFKDFKEIKIHCQNLFTGIEKVTAEQEDYCKRHNIELKPTIHKSEFILIQKYLDSPLLYYGRKFDIRCYVLVDYCFNVYMCREGHLKACSQKYDLNDLNIFTHITNYSLQKRCKDFSKYEQGNEISFKKFIELLDNTSKIKGRGKKIFNKIYSKMKEEIQISMNAVGRRLKGVPKVLSFQIFGYDFIIDKEYNPWILEINDNPGLEISSELISHLIPRMVDDALRLTIDKVFPTEYDKEVISSDGKNYVSKYHFDGFSDEENLFEFICNIEQNKYVKDNTKNKNNINNNINNNKNNNMDENIINRMDKKPKDKDNDK